MRIGYGISVAGSNQRNLVSAQAEQVIWKVAIFGAGTTTSNGEYIWDGTTLENGKPKYLASNNNYIYWASPYWSLFDYTEDRTTYVSFESLTSWEIDDALEPAPSFALSYAQDSFISSITLNSNNVEYPFSEDPFTRTLGGTAQFNGGVTEFGNAFIAFDPDPDPDEWYLSNGDEGLFASLDLITWDIPKSGGSPYPTVSAIVYSA